MPSSNKKLAPTPRNITRPLSRLTELLGELCHERLLDEKWLLAPSLRVGHQWLETVARAGQPVVNVRLKTLKALALELASPGMTARGVQLASREQSALLVLDCWNRLREKSLAGYLLTLPPSLGLAEVLLASLEDLRLAGIATDSVRDAHFEVAAKGRELLDLHAAYVKELAGHGLVDYADVLRLARVALPDDVLLLIPGDLDLTALEGALLDAIPPRQRRQLPVDGPRVAATALFSAVGEVNEVRDVLRRCLATGIPLDDVEVLHTDADTYLPLLYEETERLSEQPLATFAEGVPARYSRPGRALAGWLAWMRDDFPQRLLARMMQDGLLEMTGDLRRVPIGFGRDRYLSKLDEHLAALRRRLRQKMPVADDEDDPRVAADEALQRRIAVLETLRPGLAALLEISTSRDTLGAAAQFLREHARCANELDNFARDVLLQRIQEMRGWLGDHEPAGFDAREWLDALLRQVRVRGLGPRPGCLHVANIRSGGHSGRKHTFILGLDTGRFPGAGLQDPVLLDAERQRLSPKLRTAAVAREQTTTEFARLLARLRGEVTLSYSCRNLVDNSETFPSPVVLAAYRVLAGRADANESDLQQLTPTSFAPSNAEHCLDETDWWLWRTCAAAPLVEPERLLAACFPHLGRGLRAAAQRASEAFTAFDGFVPDAGADLNPTAPAGQVMSASSLQTLGRCPLAFFFRYALGLEEPDELEIDPTRWLDPSQSGTLLHEVFYEFMTEQLAGNAPRLEQILAARVADWREQVPPPSEGVFRRELRRLQRAAKIFLESEEEHRQTSQPVYLEAAIGMASSGAGTPLDTPEPVAVELPGGLSLRARGRIDRVDTAGRQFVIWDYKTGSPSKYRVRDPFQQGRLVQHALYLALAGTRLGKPVSTFGFVFPTERGRGDRISWRADQLAAGPDVLARLCRIVANGAFVATNKVDDCTYCDFVGICRDLTAVTEASKRKLESGVNKGLQPFKALRHEED